MINEWMGTIFLFLCFIIGIGLGSLIVNYLNKLMFSKKHQEGGIEYVKAKYKGQKKQIASSLVDYLERGVKPE